MLVAPLFCLATPTSQGGCMGNPYRAEASSHSNLPGRRQAHAPTNHAATPTFALVFPVQKNEMHPNPNTMRVPCFFLIMT